MRCPKCGSICPEADLACEMCGQALKRSTAKENPYLAYKRKKRADEEKTRVLSLDSPGFAEIAKKRKKKKSSDRRTPQPRKKRPGLVNLPISSPFDRFRRVISILFVIGVALYLATTLVWSLVGYRDGFQLLTAFADTIENNDYQRCLGLPMTGLEEDVFQRLRKQKFPHTFLAHIALRSDDLVKIKYESDEEVIQVVVARIWDKWRLEVSVE